MNAWSEITVVTSLHSRLDKFENLIFCQNVKIYLAIFGFLIKFDGLGNVSKITSGSELPSPTPLPEREGTSAEVIFDLNLSRHRLGQNGFCFDSHRQLEQLALKDNSIIPRLCVECEKLTSGEK